MSPDNFQVLPANLYTAQNARLQIECVECRKPRVIYSNGKLSDSKLVSLLMGISDFDFTCGAPILPLAHPLVSTAHVRMDLTCATPIEYSYYSSKKIGRVDLCCHCAKPDIPVDQELNKNFKVVLPICETCLSEDKEVMCRIPYGKINLRRKQD